VARSNGRRVFLNIVMLGSLGVIAVLLGPTLLQQLQQYHRGTPPAESAGWDGSRVEATTPASGEDGERLMEQAAVVREELAARERLVAAREEVLRRQVLREFWKRQAVSAAAIIAFSALVVLLLMRRLADWTGFTKRLSEEESRLRNLQLSVIGALEEFESELAAARAWAAAEARSRRPVADPPRAQPETPIPGVAVSSAENPFFRAPEPEPVSSVTPGEPPLDAFEDLPGGEQISRPVPIGTGPPEPTAPRPPTPVEPPVAPPEPTPIWPTPEPAPPTSGQGNWAHRFVEPQPPPPAPAEQGPWAEATRRAGSVPEPEHPRQGGPSTREQVEYLAAEGMSEQDIAQRLGLSQEEIHLALTLGRGLRAQPPTHGVPVGGAGVHWSESQRAADGSGR